MNTTPKATAATDFLYSLLERHQSMLRNADLHPSQSLANMTVANTPFWVGLSKNSGPDCFLADCESHGFAWETSGVLLDWATVKD